MKPSESLAMAVDIGTTTIAASLVERNSGERRAFTGRRNPQHEFGADVVSRLEAACRSEEALRRSSHLINSALEEIADELLQSTGAARDDLTVVAMAGNPAMEHFLLALPVKSLAYPPFRPLFSEGRKTRTSGLGWERDTEVYLFPLPGGFVGGDLVAFLNGCRDTGISHSGLPAPRSAALYLDLGTNGEIALSAGGKILATSAAAGPAFEGGNLACGMPALPGAIDRIEMGRDRFSFTTIGDATPLGICGSGVMDAVSGMLGTGVLDHTGRIRQPGEIDSNLGNRIVEIDGNQAFVLYRDASRMVYLSQEDIRQVQLAKAAIRAGMDVLFHRAGIGDKDLERVVLTGSFGAVLSPEGLKNVGIFTENMVEIAGFVREGALAGIERALCDPGGFKAVDDLARAIRVVPLSGTPVFEKYFLDQMDFPAV